MRYIAVLFMAVVTSGANGCASLPPQSAPTLTLSRFESLQLGSDSKDSVSNLLGEPELRLPYPDDPSREIWIYKDKEKNVQRATLSFDATTGSLKSVMVLVDALDNVPRIDDVKTRYPKTKFRVERTKWDPKMQHSAPPELDIYTDIKTGLSAVVDVYHGTVSSLSWKLPSDAIARK